MFILICLFIFFQINLIIYFYSNLNIGSYYTLLTFLPKYLNHVIGYDLENSGFAAVTPYLAMFFVSLFSGRFADYLIYSVGLRPVVVRKTMIFMGCMLPGILLASMGYLDDKYAILGCIIAAVGLSGFNIPGN